MCSKAPKPDPLIGQAAMSNAALAKEQAAVAREQLAWEKDRAEKQDPLIQKIVDQQIAIGDTNAERSNEQWQIYKDLFAPMEERMVQDANNFDSDERKDRMAAEAGADVTRGYQGALESNQRNMERMGVNPNSGRFAALTTETGLAQTKDTAGAMNKARRDTELQGMAMREGAAKFGRGMTSTGLAADAASLNAGNSATGNINAGNAAHAAGLNSAAQWFGGANAGNNSAGNLMLGQYQGQLQANQQNNDMMGGLGSLFGTGAGLAATFLRKGGLIRKGAVVRYNPLGHRGGLSGLRRRGYAEGGMIEGPGTGTSDSIPGTINGEEPVRVSNGEAVLNTGAVGITGEDFVHRINLIGQAMNENPGGLAMLNQTGRAQ